MTGRERGVAILAGEIVTSLGSVESTWQGLLQRQTGLVQTAIPHCSTDYPLGCIAGLPDLSEPVARLYACLEKLFSSLPELPPTTGLFVSTTKGAVDQLLHQPAHALFPGGQAWEIADHIQKQLRLTTRPQTISAACASGSLAAIQAAMAVAAGDCDLALVVAVDMVGEFVVRGFDSLKALSPTAVRPFDRQRDGLALGDAAAWLLLARREDLGLCPQAVIKRWGISCDAVHITAPCRKGSGLARVFEQIQGEEGVDIGGICAHGTGTVYNDAMEMLVFDEKCGREIPFFSVKGALGHSLGASGLVEILLAVKSLQEMQLPPTVGLVNPEDQRDNVSGQRSLPLTSASVLSCNSGFGGINAGVLISLG